MCTIFILSLVSSNYFSCIHLCFITAFTLCLDSFGILIFLVRLSKFDRRNWRESYNAIIVLEHLLTHGPESVAEEFQTEKFIINNMETFQHVDERG